MQKINRFSDTKDIIEAFNIMVEELTRAQIKIRFLEKRAESLENGWVVTTPTTITDVEKGEIK